MPRRLIASSRRKASSGWSVIMVPPLSITPALFTSTSSRPNRARQAATTRSAVSGRATSAPIAAWAGPSEAARASAAAASMSAIITRSPAAAKRCAAAQPMPAAPPVTRTARLMPARSRMALNDPRQ